METKFRRSKGNDGALSPLTAVINASYLARDATTVKRLKDAFSSVSALFTIIRVGTLLAYTSGFLAGVPRIPWSMKQAASN
jgi:hypothetical protein